MFGCSMFQDIDSLGISAKSREGSQKPRFTKQLPEVDFFVAILLPNASLVEMLQLLGTPSNHEAQCKGRQEL